ncbi:MAG TPA: hypothetical protein PLR71_01120 [Deltaproteobacteria bacterium]|nr:hypothetical protein [Deltaproteobacteria bacterium]HQI80133.1 hypothetical protein [Deltaproteobacteria bacterium]
MILVLAVTLALPAGRSASGQGPAVHDDIWLRNEAGERITPMDNAADPYSPRKTCGACHHYPTIVQGSHFRMGFSEQKKDPTTAHLPQDLMPSEMRPAPYGGTAVYDWIAANARLHPGGGPMECLNLRHDTGTPTNLVEAERIVSSSRNPHFQSRLTPDGRSRFRASGVLEADCLMCHMNGYRLDRRNAQVASRNYRWAATAGSGLGEVSGRVYTPGEGTWEFSKGPVVSYSWKNGMFTPEGRLSGRLIRTAVPSSSCLSCHGAMQAFRTGTLYRASDDAHAQAGLRCADCHTPAEGAPGGRLGHRIGAPAAAGDFRQTGVKTCVACHLAPGGRAPNPVQTHADLLPNATFHLRLLACTACHVTSLPAKGASLLDLSTGTPFRYSADRFEAMAAPADAMKPAREPWRPWLAILDLKESRGERYVPVALHTAQWFGERTARGAIVPLDGRVVTGAFRLCTGITTVQAKDTSGRMVKRPTIATEADMAKMLRALNHLGRPHPVFVSDKVYELKAGKVVAADLPFANSVSLPVWHNVLPVAKKQTYGAKGCTDCHDEKAPFFTTMKVKSVGRFLKDDYPTPKGPAAFPQMLDWGHEEVPSHE